MAKQTSAPILSPNTQQLHLEFPSEGRNSSQQESACASCFEGRIELSQIELDTSILPSAFIVFDLETTGLDPSQDEIIEIAAIRLGGDAEVNGTFCTLIQPSGRMRMITRINGISQAMVNRVGIPFDQAIGQFRDFIQDLPLVSFNADFDMAFLTNGARRHNLAITNPASCALKLARLAWPGRESYKLCDLAKDAGLSLHENHHALFDCKLTLVIYAAAVAILGTITVEELSPGEPPLVSPRMCAFLQNSLIPVDTVGRNLLGMELEANGQIDSAVECYQANVREGFEGNYPYDRLAVIFRRRKDSTSEAAVLTRAIEVFASLQSRSRSDMAPKLEKFKRRLRHVLDRSAPQIN